MPELNQLEILKHILESSLHPEALDSHPWTKSLFVMDAIINRTELQDKDPGYQLVSAIGKLFSEMIPSTPPKRGKRLDTSWGEFGILAAQYFAPLLFGAPEPESLREAWGRIDQSILLFVFGKDHAAISVEEKETYKLVGNELEIAANSTLSDWHRKGLMRLSDIILAREKYLSNSISKPSVILQNGQANSYEADEKKQNLKINKPFFSRFRLILILLVFILIGGLKAWSIYGQVMLVREDALHIQELVNAPTSRLERVKAIGPALSSLRQDFSKLKNDTQIFFGIGPFLKWMPVYGGELASIQDLATLADSLLASADISYQAAMPILEQNQDTGLNMPRLISELLNYAPQMTEAQQNLEIAIVARNRIDPDSLSPEIRDLILNDVDPILSLMQDGLALGLELPRILGATNEGPKTYLLLVQNEDELRPTGGFITAAGTLLIQDGKVSDLHFADSGILEDWTKPYPVAPWQLREYMNSPVLVFRDSSWFPNYPTAALYAEYLYSYTNQHSVDGVIAVNQQLLEKILSVTGPIQIEGVDALVDAGNVKAYMRAAKVVMVADGSSRAGGQDKEFMNKMAPLLMEKITSGGVNIEDLIRVLLEALDERDILLQVDNPSVTAVIERHHWDGAVLPVSGDFLMAADSNIGFNKTNAVVESDIYYEVDLTNLSSPTALLKISHKNNAPKMDVCKQWNKVNVEPDYPISDCYWNYLRVYLKAGTKIVDATPQTVPDSWMILEQTDPGKVEILDEDIEGVQAFGTLQVVPGGQSLSTTFQFSLPPDIVKTDEDSDRMIYHLTAKKQPGSLSVPIVIRVTLPENAVNIITANEALIQGNTILYKTNLRTDVEFEIVFSIQ